MPIQHSPVSDNSLLQHPYGHYYSRQRFTWIHQPQDTFSISWLMEFFPSPQASSRLGLGPTLSRILLDAHLSFCSTLIRYAHLKLLLVELNTSPIEVWHYQNHICPLITTNKSSNDSITNAIDLPVSRKPLIWRFSSPQMSLFSHALLNFFGQKYNIIARLLKFSSLLRSEWSYSSTTLRSFMEVCKYFFWNLEIFG